MTWLTKLNRRLMAQTESGWLPGYVKSAYEAEQKLFYKKQLEKIGIPLSDKTILDVGCGPAQWLTVAADSKPAYMIGADYSSEMLRSAMDAGVKQNGIHLIRSDAMNVPLRDSIFDCVICSLLLPLIPSDQRLVSELARVCKPNGRLLLSFHGLGFYLHHIFSERKLKYLVVLPVSWLSFLTGRKLLWNTYQSLSRVRRLLKKHGFEIDQVDQDWSYMGYPYIYYLVATRTDE